jgi:hypothetical protein
MTVSNRVPIVSLAAVTLAVVLSSCSKANKPVPKVSQIPNQTSNGGTSFSLDFSKYATPPAGETLTYTVLSGGGAVAGSMYSQVFDTVGKKTVKVRAHGVNNTTDFEFVVDVLTAQEAVIQSGTSLVLLDRGTITNTTADLATGKFYSDQFITVSNSQGYVDTFKVALKRGHVVYERLFGGKTDLFVFNPNLPQTKKLGDDPNNTTDERFEGETSNNQVVFTSGTAADPDLFIYSSETGLTREISAVQNSLERNAFVDSNNIVYFERGPSAVRDIYTYNPATDTLAPVSTNAANEVIVGVVTGGGVVFTRDNGAGDIDLWFFSATVGLTQIAADVSTAGFQAGTLLFKGSTSSGKVVFEHTISAGDVDLYYWDPNTLTTTVVATNLGVRDVFNGVTTNDKIIYTHEVTVADWDIRAKTVGGADIDLSTNPAKDVFQAITKLNDIVIVRAGTIIGAWDDSAAAAVLFDTGAAMTFHAALDDGNVVYFKAGVGLRRWLSTNAVITVSTDLTAAWAGSTSDGNFVVKRTVTAQDDLWFWNEATDALAVVSADAADEKFVVSSTSSGAFVFSRKSSAGVYELWVWDATNGVRKISNTGLTHTWVSSYSLDNQ